MPETLSTKPGNPKYEILERKSDLNPRICVGGIKEVEGPEFPFSWYLQVSGWLQLALFSPDSSRAVLKRNTCLTLFWREVRKED